MIQEPDLSNQNLATGCTLPGVQLSSQFTGNEHFQRTNCSWKEIYDIPIQMTESFEVSPQTIQQHPFSSQAQIELYSPPNSQESASTSGSFQHQKLAKKIKKLPSLVLNSCPNSPSEQKLKLEKTKKTASSSIKSIRSTPQKKAVEQQNKSPFSGLFSEQLQRISSGKASRTHSMDIQDNIDTPNEIRNPFPSTPQNHPHHHHHHDSLRQQKESLFKKVSKFSILNQCSHEEDQDDRINQQPEDTKNQNTTEGTIKKNKQQQRLFNQGDQPDNCQSPISKNDRNCKNYQNYLRNSFDATPHPLYYQKVVEFLLEKYVRNSIIAFCKNPQPNKSYQRDVSGKLIQSQAIKIPVDKDAEKLKKQRFNQAQMVGGQPLFAQKKGSTTDDKSNNCSRNINEQRNNSNQQDGFPSQQPSMQMKFLEGNQQQHMPTSSQQRLVFPETPKTPMKQQEQQQIQLNTCPSTVISSSFDTKFSPNFQHSYNQFSNHISDNQPMVPSNCFSQVSPSTPLISAQYSSQTENLCQVPLQQSVLFPECPYFQDENNNFCSSTFQDNQYQQQFLTQSAEPTPSYMRQLFETESDTNYDVNLITDQVIQSLNLNTSPLQEQNRLNNRFNFLDSINLDESDGKDFSDEKLFEVIGEIKE